MEDWKKKKKSLMTFLIQYKQSDHVITILNHSWMTKKYLPSIILIVQILTSLYIKTKGLTLYLLFLLFLLHLFLSSKWIASFQFWLLNRRGGGRWFWDGKKWVFLHLLICSFIHFYFYVNSYSLFNSVHWCLRYQKKILLMRWLTVHRKK